MVSLKILKFTDCTEIITTKNEVNMKNDNNNLSYADEQYLLGQITEKYDYYEDARNSQIADNLLVKYAIYDSVIPKVNAWDCKIQLPDIYELAQTLKSHIVQNLYSHPDSMFDVEGIDYETQKYANKQKAMLVDILEKMGYQIDKKKVIINNDINTLGVHSVTIVLHKEVAFNINVKLSSL